MGARTGKEYIERLKNHPPETWVGNEKITDPTTHPLVAPAVKSIARLYDAQWEADKKDDMLFKSPKTGDMVGSSFLVPKSRDDLTKRRKMHQVWAEETYGMMGRSTDFMSAMM